MVCNRNPHTHHYPDHTYPEKCPPFSRHLRTATQNNQTIRTPPPLLRPIPPHPPYLPPATTHTHTHTYTFNQNQKIHCQVHTQTYHTKTQAFVWLTFFILTEKINLFLITISNPGHPTMPSKRPRKKTDTEGFLFSIEILNIPLDYWATNPCQDIDLF